MISGLESVADTARRSLSARLEGAKWSLLRQRDTRDADW